MQISIPFQKFDRVQKAILGEIEFRQTKISDIKIYSMVLEEFGSNVAAADLFMLSDKGGYTKAELRKIKYRRNFYQTYNKKVSNPVETF